MEIIKAYKTELAPNNKQATYLKGCCGTARYVYNWGLDEWTQQYDAWENLPEDEQENAHKPSAYALCKQFNAQKDEICPWIRQYPYAVTGAAFFNLGQAFKNFFRRLKQGADNPGYPRFKSKGHNESFQVRNLKVTPKKVRITHLGWVRLKEYGYIPTDADYQTYATMSERAGRWYVSVGVTEEVEPEECDGQPLGVDLGLKSRAIFSDGAAFATKKYEDEIRKIKRLQRELSRRKKGGQNWKKTKRKLARAWKRLCNKRDHHTHQISNYATVKTKPSVIVLEDLNVKGMMANHHLARSVANAAMREIRRQIEYKAERLDIDVLIADRWFASSKICHHCGYINDDLSLSDREWVCEGCGAEIDRDLNAAKNLAALAGES